MRLNKYNQKLIAVIRQKSEHIINHPSAPVVLPLS